jgi:hypothetical protein
MHGAVFGGGDAVGNLFGALAQRVMGIGSGVKWLASTVGCAENGAMPSLKNCSPLLRRELCGAVLWALLLFAQAPGCTESRPGVDVPDAEGKQMCCDLGALCHVAQQTEASGEGGAAGSGDSDGPQTPQDCHDLGHEGDPERCREVYDQCLSICQIDAEHEGAEHEGEVEEHACE